MRLFVVYIATLDKVYAKTKQTSGRFAFLA
jgi:hypothetical protein